MQQSRWSDLIFEQKKQTALDIENDDQTSDGIVLVISNGGISVNNDIWQKMTKFSDKSLLIVFALLYAFMILTMIPSSYITNSNPIEIES